jgi:hypothetical protein
MLINHLSRREEKMLFSAINSRNLNFAISAEFSRKNNSALTCATFVSKKYLFLHIFCVESTSVFAKVSTKIFVSTYSDFSNSHFPHAKIDQ